MIKNGLIISIIALILRGGIACHHTPVLPERLLTQTPLIDTCVSPFLTYEKEIKPIFTAYCVACHRGNQAVKGIRFDDYSTIKAFVNTDTSRFFCVIRQEGHCLAMPLNNPKIPDCQIRQLQTWIQNGFAE